MYLYLFGGLVVALLLWTIGSYLVVANIEKPSYTVLEKKSGYEIREYAPYIVAETQVSGNYDQALRAGFSIVADYIFGNNTTQSKIAMTSPVLESESEKIAMTTPVLNTQDTTGQRNIAFVLPSEYTMETLPSPNNQRVTLREVPAQKVAVLRFTWYATETRVANKQTQLEQLLERDGLTASGPTQVAQYNPPLSMPLTLRNEIIIPIE